MRASSFLPVPDSPVMSTGESLRRHALDQREHRLHRRVLRHDLRRCLDARQPRLQQRVLARELVLLPRAPHQHVDLRHAIRLGEVVVGAELHRVDRRLDGAVAGDDDDFRRRQLVADLPQHLEPVHLRHHDVEQRHVERLGAQRIERGAAVAVARPPDSRAPPGISEGWIRGAPRPRRSAP